MSDIQQNTVRQRALSIMGGPGLNMQSTEQGRGCSRSADDVFLIAGLEFRPETVVQSPRLTRPRRRYRMFFTAALSSRGRTHTLQLLRELSSRQRQSAMRERVAEASVHSGRGFTLVTGSQTTNDALHTQLPEYRRMPNNAEQRCTVQL